MAKKKQGFLDFIAGLLKAAFGAAKWLVLGLWWLAKNLFVLIRWLAVGGWKLISMLFRIFGSGAKKASEMQQENKRPKDKADYEPFSELETKNGDLGDFETKLYAGKSTIGLVLGARGSGKSAIGMRICENVEAKFRKPIFAMGFARDSLPLWITPVVSLEQVKNGSFLLADEGGIEFSSRNSMSEVNKLLSELLLISRHKDISVLFISQNSANIEVNTLRQVDYLLLKTPSLLQLDFERKKIKEIYEEAKEGFAKHKAERGLTYIYSDFYRGFVSNALPSFWSTGLSKSYKNKAAKAKAAK